MALCIPGAFRQNDRESRNLDDAVGPEVSAIVSYPLTNQSPWRTHKMKNGPRSM